MTMKKILFSLLITCFTLSVIQAQDLTSKKGTPILPEAGEYGLSIDAVPFFEFAGNLFNGNSFNSAPSFDFPSFGHSYPSYTLSGKYFKSATMAYRGKLRVGYYAQTMKNTLKDQTDSTNVDFRTVDDKWTNSAYNVSLGAGIEKRRGKGRVQGVYGAMANLMVSAQANKVKYGNEISSTYKNPVSTSYPWTKTESGNYNTSPSSNRTIKDNDGMTFGIGVNAFVGVEYFFAPKMSIGGEFSFAIMVAVTGKSKSEKEYWDSSSSSVKTIQTKQGGSTTFGIDNTNTGGAINLSFYF